MSSIFLTKEDFDKLGLKIDVWYQLRFDGSIIHVYRSGKLIKTVAVRGAINVNRNP